MYSPRQLRVKRKKLVDNPVASVIKSKNDKNLCSVQIQCFNYNPMVCKDYKETGYCGYGDLCRWCHDKHETSVDSSEDPSYRSTQWQKNALDL